MSWIHVDDMVDALLRALDDPAAQGPINATAPEPVRNADFARALSGALRTPLTPWRFALPIGPPDFLLRIALGEVAQVVTQGQRVVPSRLRALGQRFRYPTLAEALAALYGLPEAGRTA
jgi:NAD dependent epimerase/dehydratase family enzyme